MVALIIVNIVLIITCAILGIYIVKSRDKSKSLSKQKEYTFALNDKKSVIRLSKQEAIAVKNCVAQFTYENGSTGLSFSETKFIK